METVDLYDNMVADMKAENDDWAEWEKEYVSGTGDWAVGGEIDIKRFARKQDAYAEFLERMINYKFLDFFKDVGKFALEELCENLDQKNHVVLLKWVFGEES